MANSSRYLQALFGIIASGRRRNPVYIRQQALVSNTYPYFERDLPISASLGFYSVSISDVVKDYTHSDKTGSTFGFFSVELRPLISEYEYSDSNFLAEVGFYSVEIRSITKDYNAIGDDFVASSIGLFSADLVPLGIPIESKESPMQAAMGFYEVSIYEA